MSDAYERLRAGIVEGEFPPGTALVEVSLAERYGTSRTPIREALRRLEQDGLVERGSRGMRVRTRSPEEILEIYEVRITLEATASGAAAQRRTELDMMRIKAAQSTMAGVSPTDPHAMAAANRTVHETIWAASHNGTIVDLLTRLNNHLTRYPATTLSAPGRWDEALAEHDAIIAAIDARNHVRAAKLAGAHMETARNLRLEIYSKEIAG